MLLIHQTGAVRVGEVVRYTLTYTPAFDRILPPPLQLHVKIKNTSAIPLRAAYLHGPYTLYVAGYPSTFDPYQRSTNTADEGEPNYEPQLKAGGHWSTTLTVPEEVRRSADEGRGQAGRNEEVKSFTWVIEVASQILFSATAAVHYEVLVGRDEKSVSLGFSGVVSSHGVPGTLEDHQKGNIRGNAQPRGVFSKAIRLRVDDTEALWNTPAFPAWDDEGKNVDVDQGPRHGDKRHADAKRSGKSRKQKKIHLVVITHGLHSNLGADMLYMKESIDTAARQAQADAKHDREEARAKKVQEQYLHGRNASEQRTRSVPEVVVAPTENLAGTGVGGKHDDDENVDEDDDEEQVLVRGFGGNAIKTEKGIQYLGKRLAKYVLSMTYPDQPYLPVKSSISQSITRSLTGTPKTSEAGGKHAIHKHSSIVKDEKHTDHNLPYRITSISFVSHSLGGLVQTYAIAYIQKHSPEFFDNISPINFVAMATPFLGLSNENPMYVKFALDFGLVGRTGQDLGLTWTAPNVVRTGWGAMVGGFGADASREKQPDPGAKPILRILPTGPAHTALKKFRNRTVYSNVVNDGIVPLRTSCLLFLDWRGLGRVEKARRENGLVGTMVNWGLSELTGQNASTPRRGLFDDLFSDSGDETGRPRSSRPSPDDRGSAVPQPEASQDLDRENRRPSSGNEARDHLQQPQQPSQSKTKTVPPTATETPNMWTAFTNLFKPQGGSNKSNGKSTSPTPKPTPKPAPKAAKAASPPKNQRIYRRGQTKRSDSTDSTTHPQLDSAASSIYEGSVGGSGGRKALVRGSSLYTNNSDNENLEAPPKTTVFESAGDLLNPPLPPKEFLLDPGARPRTIFHDRVYHPDDIPPPPAKRQRTFMRRPSREDSQVPNQAHADLQKIAPSPSGPQPGEPGVMKIEEKIARAYHRDMSWRKVLVRLEPDAHNNMIVRRMFANAYGWPVVKHMCDTHFAYTQAARTKDEDEPSDERAKPQDTKIGHEGEQVKGQLKPPLSPSGSDASRNSTRALTYDDDMPTITEEGEMKKINADLQKLHDRRVGKVQRQEGVGRTPVSNDRAYLNADDSKRTASESRESRDEVSDLISLVSAQGEPSTNFSVMHSGTAALNRLARQDSARWSDRFFEGSEDDSDEEEGSLGEELRRAEARGHGGRRQRSSLENNDGDGDDGIYPNPSSAAAVAAVGLSTSPYSTRSSMSNASWTSNKYYTKTHSNTNVGVGGGEKGKKSEVGIPPSSSASSTTLLDSSSSSTPTPTAVVGSGLEVPSRTSSLKKNKEKKRGLGGGDGGERILAAQGATLVSEPGSMDEQEEEEIAKAMRLRSHPRHPLRHSQDQARTDTTVGTRMETQTRNHANPTTQPPHTVFKDDSDPTDEDETSEEGEAEARPRSASVNTGTDLGLGLSRNVHDTLSPVTSRTDEEGREHGHGHGHKESTGGVAEQVQAAVANANANARK